MLHGWIADGSLKRRIEPVRIALIVAARPMPTGTPDVGRGKHPTPPGTPGIVSPAVSVCVAAVDRRRQLVERPASSTSESSNASRSLAQRATNTDGRQR